MLGISAFFSASCLCEGCGPCGLKRRGLAPLLPGLPRHTH